MDRFTTGDFASLVRRFEIRSTVLPRRRSRCSTTTSSSPTSAAEVRPQHHRATLAVAGPKVHRALRRFRAQRLRAAEIGEVARLDGGRRESSSEKVGAVGRAQSGVAVRIVDDRGRAVQPDTVGALLVRPPRMAVVTQPVRISGAGSTPRATCVRAISRGWTRRLRLDRGRAGDVINPVQQGLPRARRGGTEALPSVADAAVGRCPDERLGEVPVAFVVDVGSAGHRRGARCAVPGHLSPTSAGRLPPHRRAAAYGSRQGSAGELVASVS